MDTWLLLRDIELNGERNRGLYILKSRGMAHSSQIREFILTKNGIKLLDVYSGTGGVITGSSRLAQEAREREDMLARQEEIEAKAASLERKRKLLDERITALREEFQAEADLVRRLIGQQQQREQRLTDERSHMASNRKSNSRLINGRI